MSWTAADAAELDVLIDELVRCYYRHRPTCPNCATAQACQHLHTAIDEILEWRHHRELLTRAEQLRLDQEIRNAAA